MGIIIIYNNFWKYPSIEDSPSTNILMAWPATNGMEPPGTLPGLCLQNWQRAGTLPGSCQIFGSTSSNPLITEPKLQRWENDACAPVNHKLFYWYWKSYSWGAYEALEVGNNDTANFFTCLGRTKPKSLLNLPPVKCGNHNEFNKNTQKSEKIIFSQNHFFICLIHSWTL